MGAQLDQIRYAFFQEHASAGAALDLMRRIRARKSRRNLSNLLRHHEEWEISDAETWLRDDFDYLIAFFSMVEVSRLAGFVSTPLPDPHEKLARYVLANGAVRTYYEDNYLLHLPQSHLLYVEGDGVAVDRNLGPQSRWLFERFFELSQPLETGDKLETVLWFLDGGERDGVDIDHLFEVIEEPRLFIEYLHETPDDYLNGELDVLADAVQGFVEFLEFMPQLAQLLERAASYPILQSAFWHYHGYWFQQLSIHGGTNVRIALETLTTWDTRKRSREQVRKNAEFERILATLTSGRYRWPLVEAIAAKRATRSKLKARRY